MPERGFALIRQLANCWDKRHFMTAIHYKIHITVSLALSEQVDQLSQTNRAALSIALMYRLSMQGVFKVSQ